jgi:hypothetical protein
VAERLVPVRRTEARVEAGTSAAGLAWVAAGANGRSLLVRVPFAERRVLVDAAAGASVPVPPDVDVGACAFSAVLAGVLREDAFFAPAPVLLPLAEPVAAGPPLVELDRVDPARGVEAFFGADVRFGADEVDLVVGFSALMEQRYAVFTARRESDPRAPEPGTGPRSAGSGPDSAARC